MASSSSEKIEDDLDREPLLDAEALSSTSNHHAEVDLQRKRKYNNHHVAGHFLKTAALTLIPSFLRRSGHRDVQFTKSNSNIAALDGLRGIACLIVVNQHFTYNFTEQIFQGWGMTPQAYYIPQLPFICLLWSGQAMVSIFFVISGYVLSYKPLKLARAKAWCSLQETMASAAFRRVIRLYLPMTCSLLVISIMTSIGLFEPARAVKASGILTGNEDVPVRYGAFARQLWDCWINIWLQIHPSMASSTLDFHLWTLPVELRTSFTLFLTLIALSRLTYLWRTIITAILILWCIWLRRDAQVMFYCGMLLADFDHFLASTSGGEPSTSSNAPSPVKQTTKLKIIYISIFVVGLYCSSTPYWGLGGPFYERLRFLNPPSFGNEGTWLKIVGATMITLAVNQCRILQPLCTNAFAQYLGKISYALYLCHGLVIRSWGYMVIPHMYKLSGGRDTDVGFAVAWICTVLAVFPVIFWVSDIFSRLVDVPSVAFGRWLEGRLKAS